MRKEQQKIIRRGWLIIGLAVVFALLLALLVFVRLGFFDDRKEADAGGKEQSPVVAAASRKNIYDRNFQELAVSFRLTSIYARPLEIVDIAATAGEIAAVLKMDKLELQSLLKVERSFVWLGRELPAAQAEKILGLDIPGIYGIDEMHRFYPHSQIAAPLLGFVKDDQGLAGIEFQYDNVLRGIVGRDADLAGAGLAAKDGAGESGADLLLSVDLPLQAWLEKRLDEVMQGGQAVSGVAVVMDANTGAVLAMVSLPAYDPNSYWAFTATDRRNRAVLDPVFPGGLNRLFKAAAAFDQHGELVAADVDESAGKWWQESEGVFVSGNLARMSGEAIDGQSGQRFVERLALRSGSGIDLPSEPGVGGGHLLAMDAVTASTSAMDLLTVFARTMNGGVLVKPRLLAGVRSAGGEWMVSGPSSDGVVPCRSGLGAALGDVLGQKIGKRQEVIIESRLAEQLIESSALTQGKETVGIAETLPPEGDQAEPVAAAAADDECQRYHATMLGMMAGDGPSLVLVAALGGSRFDADVPSPLAGLGQEVLQKAAALGRVKPTRPEATPSAKSEHLYEAWMKSQRQPEDGVSAAPSREAGVMPGVVGFSLRKAMQAVQPHGLPVRVYGSGRVVAQRPSAGASLKGVREVILTLKMEQ